MELAQVKDALDKFFSDTTRSRSETREGIEEVIADCEGMLQAMDDDDRNEEQA